jgi:LPXTG-motif cell wall-anchored protein
MEEDENERVDKVFGNGQWGNIIYHGSGDDQTNYLPLGEGILLLAALGGAYLLGKRRKEE